MMKQKYRTYKSRLCGSSRVLYWCFLFLWKVWKQPCGRNVCCLSLQWRCKTCFCKLKSTVCTGSSVPPCFLPAVVWSFVFLTASSRWEEQVSPEDNRGNMTPGAHLRSCSSPADLWGLLSLEPQQAGTVKKTKKKSIYSICGNVWAKKQYEWMNSKLELEHLRKSCERVHPFMFWHLKPATLLWNIMI